MDPTNGEILAMVSTPRMDANEYWNLEDVFVDSTPYNRAVSELYEPGFGLKVLTMAGHWIVVPSLPKPPS
jgi:cell division protein FtsI/penicillin-binding protein 2